MNTLEQFYGAVKTRIEDRQKSLWSRIIGAGFIADDIENVWPEPNMRFFSMRYAGNTQSFQLRDLNLRELDALREWLEKVLPKESCEGGSYNPCHHQQVTVTEYGGWCDACGSKVDYNPILRNWI